MADKKITQLTDLGDGLASVDLFHVVDDPSGTPINKKITAQDVFNNIPTWVGLNSSSQSITGDGSTSTAVDKPPNAPPDSIIVSDLSLLCLFVSLINLLCELVAVNMSIFVNTTL